MSPGRWRRAIAWTLCMLVLAVSSCAERAERAKPQPRNLLLIVIDTLRADHLGAYGYERDTSPNLDRFAAEGALFADTAAQAPWTRPSVGTLLTGLYPATLGLTCGNFNAPKAACDVLAPGATTLAESLAAHGYATVGFTANVQVDAVFGFDQGFDRFENAFEDLAEQNPDWRETWHDFDWPDVTTQHVTDVALQWLAEVERDRPFFLYLHYLDPHTPYSAPERFASLFEADDYEVATQAIREDLAGYDAEIAFVDEQLGRLLEAMRESGLSSETAVVITSDHGESFGERGAFDRRHGLTLYEAQLHVPLLMKVPGLTRPGMRIEDQVALIDVMPTVLEVLGVTPPKGMQGRSLVPLLEGRTLPHVPAVSGWGYTPLFSLREPPWKLIVDTKTGQASLYDLENDPTEQNSVMQDRRAIGGLMRESLTKLLRSAQRAGRNIERATGEVEITPQQIKRLEALGYVD